jgi:hypothetical protein
LTLDTLNVKKGVEMEREMTDDRSRQNLLSFLDYLGDKGLMAKATVSSRKAAAGKVLGILSEDEARDVTKLDLDDVMRRFHNLEGKAYTPGSLMTYQSRLRSALDDFRVYLDNPMSFRPSVQPRERRRSDGKKEVQSSESEAHQSRARENIAPPPTSSALSIPIRPDTTISIQGLPYDLTESEAGKIANVIRAMAMPAASSNL